MRQDAVPSLEFGAAARIDGSLSERVRGLVGSEILKIAGEIRDRRASGHPVCNLTVGDFDPGLFPIPATLLEGVREALSRGETNYPPSDGVPSLRGAVAGYVARTSGVRYPVESILIASGARPILYAAFRSVLDPGDRVVYTLPSWNNNHYAWLAGAQAVEVPTSAENGFQPTASDLAPHLQTAQLVCLNTPLNPAGTILDEARLRAITGALLEENRRRERLGRRGVFLLFDQVYSALVFGGARQHHPVALFPEAAPWVISLDGV